MIISGLCSISYRKLNVDEIIDMVKKAGLESIEWGGDVHVPHGDVTRAKEVREKTLAAGLKMNSYGSYYRTGGAPDGKPNPDFKDVLASAEALGVNIVRVWCGPCDREKADEATVKTVLDDINRCADLAEAKGMSISFEYHGGTFTNTDENAQKLAKEVNRESVKFYWQPPHHNSHEENLAGLNVLMDRITNIHVFHWLRQEDGSNERRLLSEGKERWIDFMRPVLATGRETYAFLEFSMNDDVNNFYKDAETLKEIIAAL
jgi:3-dehydroshikimate dehydratase